MIDKRQYKRFEIVLTAGMDKGHGEIINVSRFGLLASVVLNGTQVHEGDPIDVKISMSDRNEAVLCEGTVRHVEQKGDTRVIGIEIKAMDPSAKSDILELAYKAWGKKKRNEH